jgi:hypothetical protein
MHCANVLKAKNPYEERKKTFLKKIDDAITDCFAVLPIFRRRNSDERALILTRANGESIGDQFIVVFA